MVRTTLPLRPDISIKELSVAEMRWKLDTSELISKKLG